MSEKDSTRVTGQPAPPTPRPFSDEQIKYMVDRFLQWRLPENFQDYALDKSKHRSRLGLWRPKRRDDERSWLREDQVTICIAAIHANHTIVTASDKKISFGGFFSTEGEMSKCLSFNHWIGAMAGEDISPAMRVFDEIEQKEQPDMSIEDFAALCRNAYRQQRTIGIESTILGKYGMTLDDFKTKGQATFTPSVYEHVFKELDDFELDCQFLFGGFSPTCAPHIFTLTEPGKTLYFDRTGYWAIGSGKNAAISHLASYPYKRNAPLGLCLYRVLAAKIAAETARDVGKEETVVALKTRDQHSTVHISDELVAEIRAGYESLPRVPDGIVEAIEDELQPALDYVMADDELRTATSISWNSKSMAMHAQEAAAKRRKPKSNKPKHGKVKVKRNDGDLSSGAAAGKPN